PRTPFLGPTTIPAPPLPAPAPPPRPAAAGAPPLPPGPAPAPRPPRPPAGAATVMRPTSPLHTAAFQGGFVLAGVVDGDRIICVVDEYVGIGDTADRAVLVVEHRSLVAPIAVIIVAPLK